MAKKHLYMCGGEYLSKLIRKKKRELRVLNKETMRWKWVHVPGLEMRPDGIGYEIVGDKPESWFKKRNLII